MVPRRRRGGRRGSGLVEEQDEEEEVEAYEGYEEYEPDEAGWYSRL